MSVCVCASSVSEFFCYCVCVSGCWFTQFKVPTQSLARSKKHVPQKMNESMTATMVAHKANISQVDSCLRCQRFACSTFCPSVCVRLYASVCVCVCLCVRVSVSMLHIFICGAWIIDKIKTQMASERAPKAAIRSRQWLTNIHTHTNTTHTHVQSHVHKQQWTKRKQHQFWIHS